jgi:hypothetical protein
VVSAHHSSTAWSGCRHRRRKAYTAIAAKMARIAYAAIKTERPYRSYYEHDLPGGSIPFNQAVEAPLLRATS